MRIYPLKNHAVWDYQSKQVNNKNKIKYKESYTKMRIYPLKN